MTGTEPVHPAAVNLALEMFPAIFFGWLVDSGLLVLQIIVIIFSIILIQKLMDEFGIMKFLGRITAPLMGIFGLSPNMGYSWIVAYLAGIVYGSAILMDQVKSGALTRSEADLFNHHVGISHAQVEDTLLFVALGVPLPWAVLPRLVLAFVVVWAERARRFLFRRSFRVKVLP
jgi:hypothetical membrane protein